jgi:hypothetical protein
MATEPWPRLFVSQVYNLPTTKYNTIMLRKKKYIFKPHIWFTSPGCKSTFNDLVNEINKLHRRLNSQEKELRSIKEHLVIKEERS